MSTNIPKTFHMRKKDVLFQKRHENVSKRHEDKPQGAK